MNKSTKDTIIEVATGLFADNGFDGASVRLIALKAGVNLAAINYHFMNKQNLYHEVLRSGFNQFTLQLKKIASKSNQQRILVSIFIALGLKMDLVLLIILKCYLPIYRCLTIL